jgi:hypothetical protein
MLPEWAGVNVPGVYGAAEGVLAVTLHGVARGSAGEGCGVDGGGKWPGVHEADVERAPP